MRSSRTDNRERKRKLISAIVQDLQLIAKQSDNWLEKISMQKLNNIKLDTSDMVKWTIRSDREVSNSHIYTNDHHATPAEFQRCQFLTPKKEVKA